MELSDGVRTDLGPYHESACSFGWRFGGLSALLFHIGPQWQAPACWLPQPAVPKPRPRHLAHLGAWPYSTA